MQFTKKEAEEEAEAEEYMRLRAQNYEGKKRALEKENSKLIQKPFTPSIPDTTPLDLQSVFSLDIDGNNIPTASSSNSQVITTKYMPNTKVPTLESLANKSGRLYQGGKKSKRNKKYKAHSKRTFRNRKVKRSVRILRK
jgi:hypothetical protein